MDPVAGDILVVGLGASGEAVCRYLAAHGGGGAPVRITVVDSADDERVRARAARLRDQGVEIVLGTDRVEGSYDLAVASPGIPPHSPLFRSAAAASSEMVSEIEFAYRRSRAPWLAVTGTNGKTTVTSLLAHLLIWGGYPARTVGNIGTPAIEVADDVGEAGVLVAEVSSFQLALTRDFRPRIAVLLNVTPDHLDWHGDMATYAAEKAKIFARQGPDDVAVIDADDPGSAAYLEPVGSAGVRVIPVSRTRSHPGGAWVGEGDMLTVDRPSGPLALVSVEELAIKGSHNVSNALAAAAAALAFGVPPDAVREGLRSFEPIEHRLEPVATHAGVEYFNDSKATNPDAVVKALTAFEGRPLVVLLGGRSKGSSFSAMAEALASSGARSVVFGEAAGEIAAALADAGVSFERVATMQDAVDHAAIIAEGHEGTAVLLSPGCASFDEFAGYGERGRAFKAAVAALASGRA